MKLFVFITDDWGPGRGGINSLNYDLVRACARVTQNDKDIRIVCAIPNLSKDEQDAMRDEGITPIRIPAEAFTSQEKAADAADTIFSKLEKDRRLRHYFPDRCNTFCIGHDIYSGTLSKKLADLCGGWNIVFHHMDYASYYLLKNPNSSLYASRTQEQAQILRDADIVYAVGPMLYDSACDIVKSKALVKEFTPGLAEIECEAVINNRFTPIVFGRVENDNQVIKQTCLAIDAFASAIAMDKVTPIIGRNPTLNVYGYNGNDATRLEAEVLRLQRDARNIAGRLCNIVPHTFAERATLWSALSGASVAMMLSFHEGFGLVGYEAIAAGVPLILTQNSGLYAFLEDRGLEHLVYPVEIEGSTEPKGYSPDDLDAVTQALRTIRQKEEKYKQNALKLRELLLNDHSYSWDAAARRFLDEIKGQYDLEPPLFFAPDDVTSLQERISQGHCGSLEFQPAAGKRVYSINGRDALASLCVCLNYAFPDRYRTYIYSEKSDEPEATYFDLTGSCHTFFKDKKTGKIPDKDRIQPRQLRGSILILDNVPLEPAEKFSALFRQLDQSNEDFYVFTVFDGDGPVRIAPYSAQSSAMRAETAAAPAPAQLSLTGPQKLLVKILAFREKIGYSNNLIPYICRGMNDYCAQKNLPPMFDDPDNQAQPLLDLGLIETYSKYSSQNTELCLAGAQGLDADTELCAQGLSRMGRFYAWSFYWSKDQNPELRRAYFACKCYAQAAFLDETVKAAIQLQYESLLNSMRIHAKCTSDHKRYHQALQCFIDLYRNPADPWIWYELLHCEAICFPSSRTLAQAEALINGGTLTNNTLKLQIFRLCAELEYDQNVPGALEHLIDRIKTIPDEDRYGTSWEQCLNTLINIASYCGELDIASQYMELYRNTASITNPYTKVICSTNETELDIIRYLQKEPVNLHETLARIQNINRQAKYLHNTRATGWTQGLMGECQFLLNDPRGETNLYSSINIRLKSGENTRFYRQWLLRISQYELKEIRTRTLLEKELERTKNLIPVCAEETAPPQVFISHSSREHDEAMNIVGQLESHGIRCWIAPRDLTVGSSYIKEIPRAISSCPHFLLVQSENSQNSQWVDKELILALNHQKHVLPLMVQAHDINDKYAFLLADIQFRPYYQDRDTVIREVTGLILDSNNK